MKPMESHNISSQKIWAQSDQWFVSKYAETCNGVTFSLVPFVPWLPEVFRVLVCWNIDRDVNTRVIQYLHTNNITFGDEGCRFRVDSAFSTTSEDSWIEWPRHFTGFVFDTSKPWVQTTLTTHMNWQWTKMALQLPSVPTFDSEIADGTGLGPKWDRWLARFENYLLATGTVEI